ncbi:MAG: hypothetical protein HZA90_27755 [Verrucomicrobia bacterium]|nr:hypothetical protein [Verrucomicrobiota bacterium]
MNRDQIQQHVAKAHKRPLSICTSDGHEIKVRHPDFVFFPPKPYDWEFIVFDGRGRGFEVVDVTAVTRLVYRSPVKSS